MPVIQLYYARGLLDAPRKADMARRLTNVLLQMEGGANTPAGLAFATVMFVEVPAEDWWVGGTADETHVMQPGRLLARVSIPEGYMNQAHKTEVHAGVHAAMMESMGARREDGAGVLVIIEEVTEGDWGAGGKTIGMDTIAAAVGQARNGPRYKWVQTYFDAKARQYAAAGYPADAGGLLPARDTAALP
jgi:phenylpyruvate tautomerase PptA (4-oxalocrotonate tautomerase family)